MKEKKVRIKVDEEDGASMIILEQDVVYDKDGALVVDFRNLQFPVDRFGNVIFPRAGESIMIEMEVEDEDGEWEEV